MVGSGKAAVAALLIGALAAPASVPAASSPVGIVTSAAHARIGVAEAQPGSTLFAGDYVATETKGRFVVRGAGAQIYLLETSAARFAGGRPQLHAELERGTLGFAGEKQAQVEIRAAGGIFRAAEGGPVHGQVTIVSATELLVSAVRGNIEAEFANQRVTVKEGTSHRMTLELSPQGPVGAGTGRARTEDTRARNSESRNRNSGGGVTAPQAPAAVGPTSSLRTTVILGLLVIGGAIAIGLLLNRNETPASVFIP